MKKYLTEYFCSVDLKLVPEKYLWKCTSKIMYHGSKI